MRRWVRGAFQGLCLVSLGLLTGCTALPRTPSPVDPVQSTSLPNTITPTVFVELPIEPTEDQESTATTRPPTHTPTLTVEPSATPLPSGYALVPDLRGLPLGEARIAVMDAGYSYLFQDVLNPDVPSSTIVDQDPPPGTVLPLDEVIFLFRSFQALQMYAGGECQPLQITLPAGKLLYWVELDEGVRYTVQTDFPHGRTQISDYRMFLIGEFDNAAQDSIDVTLMAPGRYVISLGPYEVSKGDLEREGSISAGCLWITPEDLNQD